MTYTLRLKPTHLSFISYKAVECEFLTFMAKYSLQSALWNAKNAKGNYKMLKNNHTKIYKMGLDRLIFYDGSDMLKIANKIYTMTGYEAKPEFNEIATKQFHSEAQTLNFAQAGPSANTINSWVEDKTNQKIKNLISPDSLGSDTRMVLVNAIYFKGFWENKFNKDSTQKKPFYLNEEDHVEVDMMSTKAKFAYGRFEDLDATAIDMPYKDSNLSMLVILPNSRTGLKELEAKLSGVNILDLNKNMRKQDVIVNMPKFKIEFSIKLNDVLKKKIPNEFEKRYKLKASSFA